MTFELGPLTFHLYGLILALSILAGWFVAKKRAHLYQIPQKLFDDPILLVPLVLSIIGARLYHVLDYWSIYKNDPYSILYIQNGGLGIFGVLAGFFLGLFIVSKVKKLNLLSLLDLVAPSMLIAQAIGRFGNFVNQEAFGPPTGLPWGIYINPQNRPFQFSQSTHFHPTFFYEAAIDAAFFILLIYLEKSRLPYSQGPTSGSMRGRTLNHSFTNYKPGQTFAIYLILYSLGRFAVEFFRTDTATVGAVKLAHILTALAFIFGVALFLKKKRGVDSA